MSAEGRQVKHEKKVDPVDGRLTKRRRCRSKEVDVERKPTTEIYVQVESFTLYQITGHFPVTALCLTVLFCKPSPFLSEPLHSISVCMYN
jgi:hypothetical protein